MKDQYTDDNIKTAKTIHNQLKESYKDRDIIFDPAKLDFLGTYEHIISNHYDINGYSMESKKKISSLLYKYFTLNKNKRKAEHWKLIFNNYRKQLKDENGNELTERQLKNWVYMDDLKKMIDDHKSNSLNSLDDNVKFLLLNIHYYGALRSSYYYNLPIKNKITGEKINYLYLPNSRRQAQYIVYDDKVSNTRSHATNNQIDINKDLHKIFLESVKNFKRAVLLPGIKDNQTFNRALKKITNSDTNNQVLRVAFETERYLNDAIMKNEFSRWAKNCYKLRHSPGVVFSTYIKNLHNMPVYKQKLIDFYTGMNSKTGK